MKSRSKTHSSGPPAPKQPAQVKIEPEEVVALSSRRWQEAGSPPGREQEFRLAAENELKLQRAGVDQAVRGQADPATGTPA